MLFRAIIKRDGTREIHLADEDWPDEDQIARSSLQNEEMFDLEDGDLRIMVTNGMALYRVVKEDADWLWIRKVNASVNRA